MRGVRQESAPQNGVDSWSGPVGRQSEPQATTVGLPLVLVTGRRSETDTLYRPDIATFEDDRGAYDQRDAEGFIRLNALRMRVAAATGRAGAGGGSVAGTGTGAGES